MLQARCSLRTAVVCSCRCCCFCCCCHSCMPPPGSLLSRHNSTVPRPDAFRLDPACSALDHLHNKQCHNRTLGVIHRYISPLLTWTGQPPLFFAGTGGLGGDAVSAGAPTRMLAGRCRSSAAMSLVSERLLLEKVPSQLPTQQDSVQLVLIFPERAKNRGEVFHDCGSVIISGFPMR